MKVFDNLWARLQAAELTEQGEAQLSLQHEREKMARDTGDFIRSALPGTEARACVEYRGPFSEFPRDFRDFRDFRSFFT
jgi:hypothetical protein